MPERGAEGPRIARILETPLYVDDVERSASFYERTLGLRRMATGDRLIPMDAGGGSVLLIFRRGATDSASTFEGGSIPPHDGSGRSHFAFAVAAEDLDAWRARLAAEDVAIESEVRWDRGGTSLYFRDPDGHSVELASPGVWPTY
jgi:catechol 2,3-dioxygenase-like lactoylglutathione lyase family enzyme